MPKYTYPAIFEKEQEGGYSIYFPDIEGCCSQANNLAESSENASDALCLMLYELEKGNLPIPTPSDIHTLKSNENDIIVLVTCDTQFYENYFEKRKITTMFLQEVVY